MVVIAVLTQGFILGSGIIPDPDACATVGADSGVCAETVRTQGLAVKDGAFPHGLVRSAAGANNGIVGHSVSSNRLIFRRQRNSGLPTQGKPLFKLPFGLVLVL